MALAMYEQGSSYDAHFFAPAMFMSDFVFLFLITRSGFRWIYVMFALY